jgi:tetraacyldisaccharide 4'-kinase
MMAKKLELYLKDIVRGNKRGLIAFLIKAILLPLSWLYGLSVNFRNRLYETGWMRRYVPPVPLVISVGNIVAGGTGKTPVTLLLAKAFYERFTVAILSRGYRSKAEKLETPILLCEGQGPTMLASYCGDEPYLFAQRLPKAIVIVGGNRKKASFLAAKAGAQAILLDDGMQHRRLARDFDVVVVDVGDPFGQGYYLPRGFLRDEIGSLVRANLIILNHISDDEQFTRVKLQLKPYSSAPVIGTKGYVIAIRNLKGQEIALIEEKIVGMFCAIAHPEYFRHTLEQEGFKVINEYILADHDYIPEKDLEQFAQASLKKGAKWIICTEKDRVKLQDQLDLALPILWVQLELRVVAGQEEWQNFLQQAEAKIT